MRVLDHPRFVTGLPYAIEGTLGWGATGVVYAARHRRTGVPVALRVLSPAAVADADVRSRLADIAPRVAELEHPGLARLLEFRIDESCVLVSERLRAPALSCGGAPMPAPAAVAVAVSVCDALACAHRQGLLHGDVKPRNVLLARGRAPKLTDLGIAETLSGRHTAMGRFGFVVGTPEYMAPEQARGELTEAADTYAAAVMLYQLLSGRFPWPLDGSPLEMVYRRLYTDPVPLSAVAPDVPEPVGDVVMAALAGEPSARLSGAAALRGGLVAAGAEVWGRPWSERALGPSPARRAAVRGRRPRRSARRAVVPALLLGALAAAPPLVSALGSAPPTVRADLAVALRLPVPRTTGLVLWRPAPRPPVARAQAAAAVVGGRMWLAGGAVPSQRGLEATGRVERFDPRGASWRIAAPLPLPLRAAMAAAWRGAPVVLGGTSPGASARGFVSARVLILRNGVWTDLAPLPEPRSAGGAATVGGRIVVAGGDAYGRPVAATDVFDGTRWRRGAPIPVPRSRPAVVTDGRHVYVLGGEDPATGAASDRVDRYDPATDRWLRLPDLPVPVAGAGATFGAGKLFVAGGERASGLTGAAEVYNLAEHRWGPLQPLATGRGALALATLGRTLYAVGGTPSGSPSAATAAAEALVLP